MPYSIEPVRMWITGIPYPQPRPRAAPRQIPKPGYKKCPVCGEIPKFMSVQMISKPKGSKIAGWRKAVRMQTIRLTQHRAVNAGYVWPGEVSLQVKMDFILPRPQAHWSKVTDRPTKGYAAAQHISSPDVDNLAKAVMDELQGVVFQRDQQVVCLRITKQYESEPGASGCNVLIRPFKTQEITPYEAHQ